MTRRGIYALTFNGTDKVYIGQSVNIDRRFSSHKNKLSKGISAIKLQNAYNKYGEPSLNILEISCGNLDILENQYIEEFDSVNNGFNINPRAGGGCHLKGEDAGSSYYSNKEIEQAFLLLVHSPEKTNKDIALIVGVSKETVDSLSSVPRKILQDKYPEEYKILNSRTKQQQYGKGKTLKERGISYPDIVSPEGISYTVENTSQFAKDHCLNNAHLVQVLRGKEKQHKGWRLING